MLYVLTIVISSLLYRIPRGGGLGEGMTTVGRLLWAFPTAGLLYLASGNPWVLLSGLTLWAGVVSSWGELFPPNGDKKKFNIRGCQLLNPFMGEVYFWSYKHNGKFKIPFFAPRGDYTEVAELICGFITALMYSLLVFGVTEWMT